MAKAAISNNSNEIFVQPCECELGIRLRLRKAGMRLERRGDHYRLMAGAQVLLDKGACGHGLTLSEIARFTRRALVR